MNRIIPPKKSPELKWRSWVLLSDEDKIAIEAGARKNFRSTRAEILMLLRKGLELEPIVEKFEKDASGTLSRYVGQK